MKYKVGIIGLGGHMKKHHLPAILRSRNAELSCACDMDDEKVALFRREYGVDAFTDPEAMLRSGNMDFIILSVPHDKYPPLIRLASKYRVNVVKDKPFARNIDEGIIFINSATGSNTWIHTTIQRRHSPNHNLMSRLLPSIGTIYLIEMRYTLVVENPHVGWRSIKQTAGGGCILDMGYHMIDLIIWYFGLPSRLQASLGFGARPDSRYDAEDSANILFNYGDTCTGSCVLSRCSGPKSELVRVTGTHGILELLDGTLSHMRNDGTVLKRFGRKDLSNHIDGICRITKNGDLLNQMYSHIPHLMILESCYASVRDGRMVNPIESKISQ